MPITSNSTTNPYSSVSDLLSNVRNFKIIESTLREGEQFANAYFSTETKIKIATMLSDFGVDYIELTNPAASPQSRDDCEAICKLGLKGFQDSNPHKMHTRGRQACVRLRSRRCRCRNWNEPISPRAFPWRQGYDINHQAGYRGYRVHQEPRLRGRVGVADTVGCASPRQVYDLVRTLRGCVSTDIEVHFHDDTGCAVANSFTALEAGATHVDTSVLGIGERNGICPLGALMARMMPTSRDYILSKYKLHQLKAIEDFVAEAVEINVPFNNPITGFCAFTHKAGIHAKAILNSPSTYEILKPDDFGLSRYVHFTSRLTGWNAIKSRVDQLGLEMTDDQVKEVTAKIKQMADLKIMTLDESDALIRSFHLDLQKDAAQSAEA
ncbi:hypothetical protein ACQRIU_004566 [Beauveria bassiana]